MNRLLIILLLGSLVAACSSTEEQMEEVQKEPEPVETVEETPAPEPDYKFVERYYVQNAIIDNDVDVEDPLAAIRVIQLLDGRNEVLVISSFEDIQEDGKTVNVESWLGIEMPKFSVGTHDIKQAKNVKFYRFYLGDKGKRLDGENFSGTIKIDSIDEEYIRGYVNLSISGVTKSFHDASNEFKLSYSGPFKIEREPLEAVIIK